MCAFYVMSTLLKYNKSPNNNVMLLLINDEYFLPLVRLLMLHGFADGFVVWLIRGEIKLHAGVETSIR